MADMAILLLDNFGATNTAGKDCSQTANQKKPDVTLIMDQIQFFSYM